MFRQTYLDTQLIEQLVECTTLLLGNTTVVPTDSVRVTMRGALAQLQNFEFNNIYEYLEALIESVKSKPLAVEILLEHMHAYFDTDCVKFSNMFNSSDAFDV